MDKDPPELPDHPHGFLIRRQVEFYFSDDNLPSDTFLLDYCNGPDNLPVPIKVICDFKRMREYQPYESVVAALRRSTILDVVDNDYIQRKVPITEEVMASGGGGRGKGRRSKKKKKDQNVELSKEVAPSARPGITKGMLKPTGFEEFYADAPMKPSEFAEEQQTYLETSDFSTRIEVAIQRYKSRRKFHQNNAMIFNRWLRFGGIDVGPKQFTGNVDQDFMDGHDAAEISLLTATHYVGDKSDPKEWAVDFEGVAKSFLSTQVPTLFFGYSESDIQACINVMRNFYNYLLHHDVCPEYKSDIEAARRICDEAPTELMIIEDLGQILPGPFNVALSALSDGCYKTKLEDQSAWNDDMIGFDLEETKRRFKSIIDAGISSHDNEDMVTKVKKRLSTSEFACPLFKTTKEIRVCLEVSKAVPSFKGTFDKSDKDIATDEPEESLGKLVCRLWEAPSLETWDIPKSSATAQQGTKHEYVFLLENHILEQCFEGMKIEATVRQLEEGLEYLDDVQALHCSFYTLLPNDLMMHWKEPEWLTSEKDVKKIAAEEDAAVKVY